MQLVLSLAPGGTERLVIEIVRALAGQIDFVVCCLDEPGAWADELRALDIPVIALGREPGFHPRLAVRLAQVMRHHQVDVVHCHHYSPYVYGLLASALAGVRVVFTEHGRLSDAKPSSKRRVINPVLSMYPGPIFAVSENLKQFMVEEGIPARRIEVVHNGVHIGPQPTDEDRAAARTRLGLTSDAFVVGTVGRLDPVKNVDALLQAHQRLCDTVPTLRSVIVGDGPERARLEAAAFECGVARSVEFTGYRSDVRELMAAFDVYVNCSIYEGVSLTILEAMASCLPVIATRVGGNGEVVADGETGFLVEGDDGIADALLRLAGDAESRRRMGDAGRRRVEQQFSMRAMVERYARSYGVARDMTATAVPPAMPVSCQHSVASPAGRAPINP